MDLGDFTVAHVVHEPGWRWSEHVRPSVGGQWCRARHIGVVLSGRGGIQMADGGTFELAALSALSAVDIPPGHDGWVIGDEPLVMLEFSGTTTFIGGGETRAPTLATLLFTDLVDSTQTAARLGDRAWRELLSEHFRATRVALDRHGGREITTTGDGLLAVFDGPAGALGAGWPSGMPLCVKVCTSVQESTSARSSGWATTCAGWLCMRLPASWARPRADEILVTADDPMRWRRVWPSRTGASTA